MEVCHVLLGNLLFLYLFSPLKTALFPHFSHCVLGVLPRLVWSQKSCNVSLFSQLWEYLRATRKWESISLGLSGSVGIKGHAVAEAVAEAPKGVARALLYIVRGSPSFLLHPSYKTFYHTFHHSSRSTPVEALQSRHSSRGTPVESLQSRHSSRSTPVEALQSRHSSRGTPVKAFQSIHLQLIHSSQCTPVRHSQLMYSQLMHSSQGTLVNALQSRPSGPYHLIDTSGQCSPVDAVQSMHLINAINAKTPHKDIASGNRTRTPRKGTAQGYHTRLSHKKATHKATDIAK